MKRVVDAIRDYVVDSARAVSESWDAFWFTPADPTLLGVIRILTGLMLLYTHAVWGLVLPEFFGQTSWLSPELVRTLQEGSYAYSFWWLVPENAMWPAYAASMVVLALFTVGLWSRITSILAFLVTVSYAYRTPAATFGLDQINAMLALYCAVGPCGASLSLDRWLSIRRGRALPGRPAPSAGANLALRLINVHMCVIYFFAGISKLQGTAWWNGEAMWLAFGNYEYQSMNMTWLAWHPRLIDLATHVTVIWEITFAALIWKPRIRPLVLFGAVVLHVGIGACLGMWTFGLIMLVGCASFLPTEGVGSMVHAMLRSRRRRPSPSYTSVPSFATSARYSSSRLDVLEPALATVDDEH